jgi:hypothetical protein
VKRHDKLPKSKEFGISMKRRRWMGKNIEKKGFMKDYVMEKKPFATST